MKKGEIATSTIIWISISIIVLVVVVGGIIMRITQGTNGVDLEKCRLTNDANDNGIVDSIDPCPCDGAKDFTYNGIEDCKKCPQYINCEEKSD